jgi:predicted N-acyltransferase
MHTTVATSLDRITATEWNRLLPADGNPFLRHEFLAALERHGCVGERWGWLPRHLLAYEGTKVVGAAPLYLKYNSYGEFVFDWSWAEAYRRAGLAYYPKLVAAVPYTPVTGPRLLVAPDADTAGVRSALTDAALELARELKASSLHWLFTDPEETRHLAAAGLARRMGCQFHWCNRGYRDFDDFLDGFTAAKRKKIRRERRRVTEAGIELEVLDGHAADQHRWRIFYDFYQDTFDKLGGYATLSLEFFQALGAAMPDNIVLVLARREGDYVAGALSLRGKEALYGRHWGCREEYHSLHFEACYYAGIDYAISHGLRRFEPGAQGEHKVARGFIPTSTWSAHWIAHPDFAEAVERFTREEQRLTAEYMRELTTHLPYKGDTAPVRSGGDVRCGA